MKTTNIKMIIIIILLVVFSLSATYAYLNLETSSNNATGEGGCFLVAYSGVYNGIYDEESEGYLPTITKLVSTQDYSKATNIEIGLSRDENCKIYTTAEIILHNDEIDNSEIRVPISSSTTAPSYTKALKYKVVRTSGDGTIQVNATETTTVEGVITEFGDTTLATVNLTDTNTTYDIYIWLDSSLSLGYYEGKTFSGHIYAKAIQTSTIDK